MYTIRFPDHKPFTGEYLSVTFKGGEGQTENDYLAERFSRKGMEVSREPQPEQEPKPEQELAGDVSAEPEQEEAQAENKKAGAKRAKDSD